MSNKKSVSVKIVPSEELRSDFDCTIVLQCLNESVTLQSNRDSIGVLSKKGLRLLKDLKRLNNSNYFYFY